MKYYRGRSNALVITYTIFFGGGGGGGGVLGIFIVNGPQKPILIIEARANILTYPNGPCTQIGFLKGLPLLQGSYRAPLGFRDLGFQGPYCWVLKGSRALTIRFLEA